MKVAIFVLADLFVPLMLATGTCLEERHGHTVRYLSFLPHDHKLLSRNTDQLFPRHLESLDGTRCKGGVVFTEAEVSAMVNFMRLKHGGSLRDWYGRVNAVARYLEHFIQQERPDAFVLWNGQDHIGQVIRHLCHRQGLRVIYMENGYFSNTLQADCEGVNAAASQAHLDYHAVLARAETALPHQHAPETAPAFELKTLTRADLVLIALAHRMNPRYYAVYPEQRGTSRIKTWRIGRYRDAIPQDEVTLPEKFAFVPFQVHDDTQVLLNSKLVNTVEDFFKLVHCSIRRTCGPDFPIIVKEHPEDIGRHDYSALRQSYPDVVWLRKFDIEMLLDQASMVFVINSSVGLQAVRRKKPTVVMGESFYSKPEIAFVVKRAEDLDAVVTKAARGVDAAMAERIDRFIEALNTTLFVKGTWKYPACVQAAPAVAQRIVDFFRTKEASYGA